MGAAAGVSRIIELGIIEVGKPEAEIPEVKKNCLSLAQAVEDGLWLLLLGFSPPSSILHQREFGSHYFILFDLYYSLVFIINPTLEIINSELVCLAPGHSINKSLS